MRRLFLALLIAVSVAMAATPAWAADGDLSDEQLSQIRQNCKQVQSVMQRLQTTDVATRINRGRIYENLISKLITPLNSRVSTNSYNAADLTIATGEITKQFNDFKSDYSSYANLFSRALSMNCEADPAGFYTVIQSTRDGRERVSNDITNLNGSLNKYEELFTTLRSSIGA